MRTKKAGFALLILMLLTVVLPLAGANAFGPDVDDYRDAVVRYMKHRHQELSSLNDTAWEFEMGSEGRILWGLIRYRDVDANGTCIEYELDWSGKANWIIGFWHIKEYAYHYLDYWDIEVAKVGPGTTVGAPGVYYVKPGNSYEFTAVPGISSDEDWRFIFEYWTIWDGETLTKDYNTVLSGTATKDLTVTAVFKAVVFTSTYIVYEDGLNMGYMWRDDHAILVVRPKGQSPVTVSIVSDHGLYQRTFYVNVKSLCIYFKPYWFQGDYTITVTATDTLSYLLAGVLD